LPQGIEQPVGKGGEPQPQLIVVKVMVGGAVAEEVELLFFEAIFHLPSGTVALGMEALGTHLLSLREVTTKWCRTPLGPAVTLQMTRRERDQLSSVW
jgi:hypothetical protein